MDESLVSSVDRLHSLGGGGIGSSGRRCGRALLYVVS
jgi:hypothetical protein